MTIEEIKTLSADECESRLAEIKAETETDNIEALSAEHIEELKAEVVAISERKAALAAEEEERRALADQVAQGAGTIKETSTKEKTTMTFEEMRASKEYNHAFAQFIRTGNDTEIRSLTTTAVDGNGAVAVPAIITEGIEHAWEEQPLLAGIRKVYVKGVVNVPVETSASDAVIHTEGGEAVSEEELVITNITITPQMIKKWIAVTDELLGMSDERLLEYVRDEIAQKIVEKAVAEVLAAIVASLQTVNSGNGINLAADPTLQNIFDLMAAAEHAKNPVFVMTRAEFFGKIMAMTDNNDRPIWNVVMENGEPRYMLLGCPVDFADMPDGYDRFYAFGEKQGILGNFPNGETPEILVDPYTLATEDKVRVIGKLLFGVAAVKPDSFAVAVTATV